MIGKPLRPMTAPCLSAGEAALDLFFETWRLTAEPADPVHSRRLRLGALQLVRRVTAIGMEETRVAARQRLREARVELRRLVQAAADGRKGGKAGGLSRWNELAVTVGVALSHLNQEFCSPGPWLPAQVPGPSTFDPQPPAQDSRLKTQDYQLDSN